MRPESEPAKSYALALTGGGCLRGEMTAVLRQAFQGGSPALGALAGSTRYADDLADAGQAARRADDLVESVDDLSDAARSVQRISEVGETDNAFGASEYAINSNDLKETLDAENHIEYSNVGGNHTEMYGDSGKALYPTHRPTHSRKSFQQLINNIAEHGIFEPIKYVEYKGNRYIVDGHHRFWAAQQLGLEEIPIQRVSLPYKGYRTPIDLFYE